MDIKVTFVVVLIRPWPSAAEKPSTLPASVQTLPVSLSTPLSPTKDVQVAQNHSLI